MSSADPLPQQSGFRNPMVASELGSARLEGAEPDADIIVLAETFAAGELSEADFDAAVEQHQQALVARAPSDRRTLRTPALAAQQVAARAADMARKGYLRVAGVVENMSASVAPDGTRYAVFGSGGGERLAEQLGVALLGSIPSTRPWPPGATPVSRPRSPRRTHRQPKPSPPWPSASSPRPSRSSRWSPCTARQFFEAAGLLNPMPEPQAHGGYQDPTH